MASIKKDINWETKVIELLKEKKLSITVPRKMIIRLLLKEHGPFSAEEIYNKLPKNTCDQVTVYRCLNQFVETQLVTPSYFEKEMVLFEFNDPHHHHHHIICKICKKIDSFHDCILNKIETSLAKKGYKDIQHRLEFIGVCGACQNS